MLTDKILKQIKPPIEKPYKITDTGGLYAYVSKTGVISFRYDFKYNSKRLTKTIGRYGKGYLTLAQARDEFYLFKSELIKGNYSTASKNKIDKTTLDEYFKPFSIWITENRSKKYVGSLKSTYKILIKKEFGSVAYSKITNEMVRDYIINNQLHKNHSSNRIKIFFNILSQYLNTIKINIPPPISFIKGGLLKPTKKIDRFLTPLEISLLVNKLREENTVVNNAIELLLLTSLRIMELLTIEWSDIDLNNRLILIPKNKTKLKREHIVYLSDRAVHIINNIHSTSDKYLFSLHGKKHLSRPSVINMLNKIIDDINIDRFTPHDFRRTFSTHLNDVGANPDWIEAYINHATTGVRGIYNRAIYKDGRIKLAQVWSEQIDEWVLNPESKFILKTPNYLD